MQRVDPSINPERYSTTLTEAPFSHFERQLSGRDRQSAFATNIGTQRNARGTTLGSTTTQTNVNLQHPFVPQTPKTPQFGSPGGGGGGKQQQQQNQHQHKITDVMSSQDIGIGVTRYTMSVNDQSIGGGGDSQGGGGGDSQGGSVGGGGGSGVEDNSAGLNDGRMITPIPSGARGITLNSAGGGMSGVGVGMGVLNDLLYDNNLEPSENIDDGMEVPAAGYDSEEV